MEKPKHPVDQLAEVMAKLRDKESGCPWDIEQTHVSLIPHLIEETYEVIDCIRSGEYKTLKEELGDVLLQIAFHSQLANERNEFSMNDVASALTEKLISRHPHVFGDTAAVKSSDDVKKIWRQQKSKEGKKSTLGGIPKSMPALQRAMRMSEKACGVGFDWPDPEAVWQKYDEELAEVKEAIAAKNQSAVSDEFGDLFFCLINLCRKYGIDPELALQSTNDRFARRFAAMEKSLNFDQDTMEELSLEEWEEKWQAAKKISHT